MTDNVFLVMSLAQISHIICFITLCKEISKYLAHCHGPFSPPSKMTLPGVFLKWGPPDFKKWLFVVTSNAVDPTQGLLLYPAATFVAIPKNVW